MREDFNTAQCLQRRTHPRNGLFQVVRIDLNADEIDPELRRRDSAAAQAEERIHRRANALESMELEALLRHARRKRRGMGAILVAALNGLVGNEPGVSAAAKVPRTGAPPGHVGRILVGNADRLALQRRTPGRREMKDELMAIVHESIAVD